MAPTIAAHVGHDQAWDLYAASAAMHGVKLNGPRLVEVNPPFLVWFFSLPALLANMLHISLSAGFRTFWIVSITALIAWSASLYGRVCRASRLGMWLFVLCAMYIASAPVGLDDRGQREYFTAFLLLPYVLWAASRLRNIAFPLTETFVVAFFAAVGVCLKPQHVLDIVAVEFLVLIRLRSVWQWFQPSLTALVAVPALYILAVRIFSPSYLRDTMPLLKETYWGFDKTWSAVADAAEKQVVAFAVALFLYINLRRRLRVEPIIACLLAASTGALLAYLQQHKGWSYQLLALQILSYLAIAIICCDVVERMGLQWSTKPRSVEARQLHTSLCVGLAILAFVIAVSVRLRHMRPIPYFEVQKTDLANIYSEYPPGTPVGLLAVEPWEWPEVLEQNKVWASRYMHLWSLPAIVRSQDPLDIDVAHHLPLAKISELSDLLRQTTAEDLAHWRPAVVVIEPCDDPDICSRAEADRLSWPARLV